jgi:hypothetical protein
LQIQQGYKKVTNKDEMYSTIYLLLYRLNAIHDAEITIMRTGEDSLPKMKYLIEEQ